MFALFRKWQSRQPTAALCQALLKEGLPPGMDPSTLRVALQRGSYSGRLSPFTEGRLHTCPTR